MKGENLNIFERIFYFLLNILGGFVYFICGVGMMIWEWARKLFKK
tara:strand:- start:457 stop:591 length:135 start_codon:yes stop_codon:yes gene_type:complete